ncbi:unnamed protein product [Timema podura]|uniref:2,3-bisphosphoglycerate 3-phosphatase n=1 Tax=Timema podura TaxID=61482 RepID=A0ABN7NNA7_TIMPD|nr:unnamed protein product [Timema podura]
MVTCACSHFVAIGRRHRPSSECIIEFCSTLILCLKTASDLIQLNWNSKHISNLCKQRWQTYFGKESSLETWDKCIEGCQPVRAWLMVRHGTRYPGHSAIVKMRQTLPKIREHIIAAYKDGKGSLCTDEILYFENWKPQVEDPDHKRLAHEGEDEMVDLAERFQIRFPNIFEENYVNDSFKFQYTASQRTSESARYFTVGLFGKKDSKNVWFPEALHQDPILRFYKSCQRWKIQVDKNPESLIERFKFENGPEMKAAAIDINKRLGLNGILDIDAIYLMYITCSFETAWDRVNGSPWCAAFSEENLKVFEYSEDLEYYWIDGYGFNITHRMACPALRDMMLYLMTGQTPNKKSSPKAVVYFSHSGAMLKMLSHLGLYKDNLTLLHDNYHMMEDRRWKVSNIDCFGSNLAFVLFRCKDGDKVLTYHQERSIVLPGCPLDDLCPLSTLKNIYHDSLYNCDFDNICALNTRDGNM